MKPRQSFGRLANVRVIPLTKQPRPENVKFTRNKFGVNINQNVTDGKFNQMYSIRLNFEEAFLSSQLIFYIAWGNNNRIRPIVKSF